jgi:hypothetical protein
VLASSPQTQMNPHTACLQREPVAATPYSKLLRALQDHGSRVWKSQKKENLPEFPRSENDLHPALAPPLHARREVRVRMVFPLRRERRWQSRLFLLQLFVHPSVLASTFAPVLQHPSSFAPRIWDGSVARGEVGGMSLRANAGVLSLIRGSQQHVQRGSACCLDRCVGFRGQKGDERNYQDHKEIGAQSGPHLSLHQGMQLADAAKPGVGPLQSELLSLRSIAVLGEGAALRGGERSAGAHRQKKGVDVREASQSVSRKVMHVGGDSASDFVQRRARGRPPGARNAGGAAQQRKHPRSLHSCARF